MRKQQKDTADLGVFGIVREAFRLLGANVKPFLLIQLTLILPITILVFVIEYNIQTYLLKHLPQPPPPPPAPGNSTLPHSDALHERLSSNVGTDDDFFLLTIVVGLIAVTISSIVSIFALVAGGVADSAILYSVGLIYTGKKVTFLDVVQAAIPRLWARLTATYLYLGVLNAVVAITTTVILDLLMLVVTRSQQVWVMLAMSIVSLLIVGGLLVFGIYLQLIRLVASGVSILEDQNYGWAAIQKARKLLQGKKRVAVLFQILWIFPSGIIGLLVRPIIAPNSFSADPIWRSALLFVALMVFATFLALLTTLCAGVQYASFKAYHNESIPDSSVKKSTHEGHEPLLDEDDDSDNA